MSRGTTTRGRKKRVRVENLPAKAKTLTAKQAKKVKGGESRNVSVAAVRNPAKSGRPTKLMEEEGIY